MTTNTADTTKHEDEIGSALTAVRPTRRRISPQVQEAVRGFLTERTGPLPIWFRAPVRGPEHYTGFTRAKLYQLAAEGHIRSVSIREPGKVRGCRLFNLASILAFIEASEDRQTVEAA